MELLKHELYKIFSKKILYTALLFFLLVTICLHPSKNHQRMYGDVRDYYTEYFQQYEGPVTPEKVKLAEDGTNKINEYIEQQGPSPEGFGADTAIYRKLAVYSEILSVDQKLKDHHKLLNTLEQRLKTMENKDQDNYEYKKTKLHYSMVKNINTPGIYFNLGWSNTIDFINTLGLVIMGAMILLGVSSIFSDEYSTNMNALILSSKNGKSRAITAKFLAAGIYILIIALFFTLLNLIIQFEVLGFMGWNSPLQGLYKYKNSPYGWTFLQYFPRQITVHLFGSLAFGSIVLLISSLCRSSLISFFISGCIFGLPIFFRSILYIRSGWIAKINEFSCTELMRVEALFNQFKTFNIFGHPVLYLNLMLVLYTFLSIIVIYLNFHSFRSHQVN